MGNSQMIFLCLQWCFLQCSWPMDFRSIAQTWQFWFFVKRDYWRLWGWSKQWRHYWIPLCLLVFQWLLCLHVQLSWNYFAISFLKIISFPSTTISLEQCRLLSKFDLLFMVFGQMDVGIICQKSKHVLDMHCYYTLREDSSMLVYL
jgi:hypothetical protein